jgi:hypothetical protein
VHLVAKWDSVGSTNNVASFDTIVYAYAPTLTALAGNQSTGGDGPIKSSREDEVDRLLSLGGDGTQGSTVSASKVSKKGDSTTNTFEALNFLNGKTISAKEYDTIACNCTDGSSPDTDETIYSYTTWDASLESSTPGVFGKTIDIEVVVDNDPDITNTDVDNSGGEAQDTKCEICCRDAPEVSLTTFKTCRLGRVDGILRLHKPWKLIGYNLVPESYFNDSATVGGNTPISMTSAIRKANTVTYSDYIAGLIRQVLAANPTEADFNAYTTIDTSFSNVTSLFTDDGLRHTYFKDNSSDARQLQALAIYLDYPPSGIYTTREVMGTPVPYTPADVPLEGRVVVTEKDQSLFSGWIPDRNNTSYSSTDHLVDLDNLTASCGTLGNPSRNYVTNDALEADCEDSYSRGKFFPRSTDVGNVPVTTRIYQGNDGFVDRTINSPSSVNSSLLITVE